MNLTYMHHEHYDGTGYPQGLAGEDISIGAHIIQLSDTYDAMTTQRAYREAMPTHIAFDILIEESGYYLIFLWIFQSFTLSAAESIN